VLFWCWADTASRSRSQPKMEDNLFTSPKLVFHNYNTLGHGKANQVSFVFLS
jgi:hypothetical protein